MPEFDALLRAIATGAQIDSEALLPYLCLESRQDRLWANYCLAEAFQKASNHAQAAVFIQRVWNLSVGDEKYLPLFIDIHAATGDVESIRHAHKALGLKKAAAAKVTQALDHFHNWQYAFAVHKHADRYQYDFEVLDCIAQLAAPHAFNPRKSAPIENRKVRLAYLMFGMTHLNSVIVNNSLTFAKFHDASKFDVTFYVPDQATTVLERPEAVENIKKIEQAGWKVVLARDSFSELKSLHEFAKTIYEDVPDILVTNAALADFRHFYITALRPAPLIVGLCQGPPAQYIAPSFDWSISWTRHPMIDCPTNCTLVAGAATLPERSLRTDEAKTKLGIPEDQLVVMSCGRPFKFQDQGFWRAILDMLRAHSKAHFVVVGVDRRLPFLKDLLTPDIAGRVRIIGRVKAFHSVLSVADVMVDTYPSGGGMTVVDAMALGIPVVSFRNDYMKPFDQTEWSPAAEFMGMSELLVNRGNFTQMRELLDKLLRDSAFRRDMAGMSKQRIHETYGNPAQMIRDCEAVYLKVMKLNAARVGAA